MPTTLDQPPVSDADWARIVDSLTRRQVLTGGAGGVLGIGLAACGSGTSAGPAAKSATRLVSTTRGPVRVPADPKRLVVVNPIPMSTLYDLGVSVTGVYDEGAEYVSPRYLARYRKAAKVGTAGQVNVEKIAALNPDLIIGADVTFNSSVYAQLSKLAPTVLVPVDGTWQQTATRTAEAVGRTSKLAAFRQRLAARSHTIGQTYATELARYRWDILQGGFDPGQFWLYGPRSPVGQILAGAGVRFASGSAGVAGATNRSVSYEDLSVLSTAGVIGFYSGYNDQPNNEGPQLFEQTGFKALPAAKAGRLVPLPDFLPAGYGDALAVLDELEAGLTKLSRETS